LIGIAIIEFSKYNQPQLVVKLLNWTTGIRRLADEYVIQGVFIYTSLILTYRAFSMKRTDFGDVLKIGRSFYSCAKGFLRTAGAQIPA
jgi:hypothetical protein